MSAQLSLADDWRSAHYWRAYKAAVARQDHEAARHLLSAAKHALRMPRES